MSGREAHKPAESQAAPKAGVTFSPGQQHVSRAKARGGFQAASKQVVGTTSRTATLKMPRCLVASQVLVLAWRLCYVRAHPARPLCPAHFLPPPPRFYCPPFTRRARPPGRSTSCSVRQWRCRLLCCCFGGVQADTRAPCSALRAGGAGPRDGHSGCQRAGAAAERRYSALHRAVRALGTSSASADKSEGLS